MHKKERNKDGRKCDVMRGRFIGRFCNAWQLICYRLHSHMLQMLLLSAIHTYRVKINYTTLYFLSSKYILYKKYDLQIKKNNINYLILKCSKCKIQLYVHFIYTQTLTIHLNLEISTKPRKLNSWFHSSNFKCLIYLLGLRLDIGIIWI